jgi:putative transposase
MEFTFVESAQTRWRTITGVHLAPLVRALAEFEGGVLVERDTLTA